MGMSGPTGLDYSAVYPLLDRVTSDPEAWQDMFDDIQAMEIAALNQMAQDRAD